MKKRGYDKAWKEFVRWCRSRGLKPLPANPWAIAAYLKWCERRKRPHVMDDTIKAIARAHLINGLKSPDRHSTVVRTMRMIETRSHSLGVRSDLFKEDDFLERGEAKEESPPPTNTPAKRPVRLMRSTPKLVSRRPG